MNANFRILDWHNGNGDGDKAATAREGFALQVQRRIHHPQLIASNKKIKFNQIQTSPPLPSHVA